MIDNIDILKQGAMLIAMMLVSFIPEIYLLYKNTENKGVLCFLGIMSKIAIIYFFSVTITSTTMMSNNVYGG